MEVLPPEATGGTPDSMDDELRPAMRRQAAYHKDSEDNKRDRHYEVEEDVDESEEESNQEALRRRGWKSKSSLALTTRRPHCYSMV
ncbi:hypothetical protein BD309DRAFT_968353 [Dichomitus squalens]|nr:hypothetical protein BD309DRAFT_968353 [Dichomitus squalens]